MNDLSIICSSADISQCGKHRYSLTRTWDPNTTPLIFIGLNPSTADASKDDPTIRRCMGFARENGSGGLVMLNLFSFRATDPRDLMMQDKHPYVVRAFEVRNDEKIKSYAAVGPLVFAWGNEKPFMRGRIRAVEQMTQSVRAYCLGYTKNGSPRHPLYVKGGTQLELFKRQR